jgi:hypothetical protein
MGLGFGIRDPGSGKNLNRIPDPGKKRPRIWFRNTGANKVFFILYDEYVQIFRILEGKNLPDPD